MYELPLDIAGFDQHLLSSQAVVRRLVDVAAPTHRDVVADLGAGTGVITRELAVRAPARVYAIELDQRFAPFLRRLSREHRNVEVLTCDILDACLPDVTKVVANPPFRITERLIRWLHRLPALTSASLVMGRSFGSSATAVPGSHHYNRLSLEVQARFAVQVVGAVAREHFLPPAGTPACIVRMVPMRRPASIDAYVAGAFSRRGGMRVKDLLWQLRTNGIALGPPSYRRKVVAALRRSPVVRDIHQRRLQQVTSADLSRFMAELHRLADHEASAGGRTHQG